MSQPLCLHTVPRWVTSLVLRWAPGKLGPVPVELVRRGHRFPDGAAIAPPESTADSPRERLFLDLVLCSTQCFDDSLYKLLSPTLLYR